VQVSALLPTAPCPPCARPITLTSSSLHIAALSIDAFDVSGTAESDISHQPKNHFDVHKVRLSAKGRRIGRAEYQPHHVQDEENMDVGTVMHIDMGEAMRVGGWLVPSRLPVHVMRA
jgi:hypothetical protein